jgi:hypothetical protein
MLLSMLELCAVVALWQPLAAKDEASRSTEGECRLR